MRVLAGGLGVAVEARVRKAAAADIRLRQLFRRRVRQPDRASEMPERGRAQPGQHPPQVGLIGHLPGLADDLFPWLRRIPGQQPPEALGFNQRLHRRPARRRDEVEYGLPVAGDEGIHVDQLGDPFRDAIGNPADHRPARARPGQDHLPQVLIGEHAGDIVDVRPHDDSRMREMRAFPQAGERRRAHAVPMFLEQGNKLLPAPASEPGGMHENENGQCSSLPSR
jgi:hypothetical protein